MDEFNEFVVLIFLVIIVGAFDFIITPMLLNQSPWYILLMALIVNIVDVLLIIRQVRMIIDK